MEFHLIARDLNGLPIGRHQFIVIITDGVRSFRLLHSKKLITSRRIGSKYGVVLGAHNIKVTQQSKYNRLTFIPFEPVDFTSAVEYFGGAPSLLAGQFGYQIPQGKQFYPNSTTSDEDLAEQILKAIDYYVVNEENFPIAYPLPWFGKNSNSWVNSILDVVSIRKNVGLADFDGADAAHDVRIDTMYFKGKCQRCKIQNPAYR
jgi:hypothetical protein